MTKKILLLALATTLIFFVGVYFWWQDSLKPVSQIKQEKIFVIAKRESIDSIAVRLKNEGLIHSQLAFKFYIYQAGLKDKIQSGSFKLSPNMDLKTLVTSLTHGTADVRITFPEGMRREEIAAKLVDNLPIFDSKEFLNLTTKDEGKLFPDTYLIPQEITSEKIRQIFLSNYDKKFTSELKSVATNEGLNEVKVLILASIVEREAKNETDRAIVAGILLKRLNEGMPLQVDATIQYLTADKKCQGQSNCNWWQSVNHEDLKVVSLFNTYLNQGLPPSPICNPSLSSIKAVIYPTKTDYLFYLTDNLGQMHYAKTGGEHNQNVEKYLN